MTRESAGINVRVSLRDIVPEPGLLLFLGQWYSYGAHRCYGGGSYFNAKEEPWKIALIRYNRTESLIE